MVFATLPFHAFLGVTIMRATTLIAGDWYPSLDRDWARRRSTTSTSPADPVGLRATWSALVIFGVLFVQWVRAPASARPRGRTGARPAGGRRPRGGTASPR